MIRCEHSGPTVTDRDFDRFFEKTGCQLPESLMAFLKEHNGGAVVSPADFRFTTDDGVIECTAIEFLFPLFPSCKRGSLLWAYFEACDRQPNEGSVPAGSIPFGQALGRTTLLLYGGAHRDIVWLKHWEYLSACEDEDRVRDPHTCLYKVSDSLPEFFEGLADLGV